MIFSAHWRRLWQPRFELLLSHMKRILPFLLILAVLGVALGSVWYLTQPIADFTLSRCESPAPASSVAPASQTPPPLQLGPANDGRAGSRTCKYEGTSKCSGAHRRVWRLSMSAVCDCFIRYSNRWKRSLAIRLTRNVSPFPLVPNHQHALRAASAAEAAGLQGKFWEMHKLIYEHQKIGKISIRRATGL